MMRFDRFTERAQEAAQRAAEIIQRYGHNQIDTEHILLALIEQPGGVIPQILEKLSVSPEALTERLDATLRASPKANIFGGGAGQIFITPRVKRIIDLANEEANRLKDEYISTEHIFLAILTERNTPAARILESAGLTRDRVHSAIQDLRGGQRVTDPQAESRYRTLEKYSRDLTQLAREGKLDPVIGRDNEIMRLIQILVPPHQEQSCSHRRSRRRQDRHRGRTCAEDRQQRRTRDPFRQTRGCARPRLDDRRFTLPR